MNIGNKYIVAIIAAAATGLPQGINASPLQGMAEVIPADTVYIITAFGLIGGVLMAFGLIKERLKNKYFPSKYIDLYTFFVVGVLCIGLPIFFQNHGDDWQSSNLFMGYFFTAAGLGLLIGGALNYAIKRT